MGPALHSSLFLHLGERLDHSEHHNGPALLENRGSRRSAISPKFHKNICRPDIIKRVLHNHLCLASFIYLPHNDLFSPSLTCILVKRNSTSSENLSRYLEFFLTIFKPNQIIYLNFYIFFLILPSRLSLSNLFLKLRYQHVCKVTAIMSLQQIADPALKLYWHHGL